MLILAYIDIVYIISCDVRFVYPDKTKMGFHFSRVSFDSSRASFHTCFICMYHMKLKTLLSDHQFWFPTKAFTIPQWLKTVEKCLFSTIRENYFIIFFSMRHYSYSDLCNIPKILIPVICLCVQRLEKLSFPRRFLNPFLLDIAKLVAEKHFPRTVCE